MAKLRARFPIGLKLGLMATLLTVIPLAAVGLILIDVNARAIEELSREAQLLALDDLARTIDQEFVEAQDSLDTIGSLFGNAEMDTPTKLEVTLALVQGQESLDHVALYDAQGVQLAVVEEDGTHAEVPQTLSAEIRAQIEELHVATGEVTVSDGVARVLLAVRIRSEGETTGYAASNISLDDVQTRVERLAEGHFHGLDDTLYVVDQDLRIVAHTNRERAVTRDVADSGILEGVTAEMLGPSFSQAGEYVSEDGTEMLGSSVGIPGRPWALVAQIPLEVAYASLERMKLWVGGTISVAILLALFVGLLTARGISAPVRRLTDYARALAERRFDAKVEVNTRDELAILGQTMNQAASDLLASEEALKREVAIRTDLGRYVSGKIVDKIVAREQAMTLGGHRRKITVMFADVVGFTPLTEQLEPEHVVAILNELFTILTEIVFKHDGTVDKFVGDCVMALWGAPSDQPDQAQRAVEAAEDMLDWLETSNERWQERYGVTIQLAIGIHCGEAVVGNIGSETRMEYTAIGDVVNMAARLEAVARPQQILVTDAVASEVGDGFDLVDADLHRLSGWAEPVHLWEVRV